MTLEKETLTSDGCTRRSAMWTVATVLMDMQVGLNAKVEVLGITKSAGVEYAPRGIRINAVCPGTFDTPILQDILESPADAMAGILREQSIVVLEGRRRSTPRGCGTHHRRREPAPAASLIPPRLGRSPENSGELQRTRTEWSKSCVRRG